MTKSPLTNENDISAQDGPLDPAVEKVRQKIMRFMIVTICVTFLLIFFVIMAVIMKVKNKEDNTKNYSSYQEFLINLPENAKIYTINEEEIFLETKENGKKTFLIYD